MLLLKKLKIILAQRSYRWLTVGLTLGYLLLYLTAIGNITFNGTGFEYVSVDWTKMFLRSGFLIFEPIYRISTPFMTMLISPLNYLIGTFISLLVGLNLTVTYIAFRRPRVCKFNRTTGIFASLPALLAGGACCAPVLALIFGLQMSTLLVTVSNWIIPIAVVILIATLIFVVGRTRTEFLKTAG